MQTLLLICFVLAGLVATALGSPDPNEVKCPDAWERVHRGCYKFATDGLPWQEANEECKSNHGELVSIQSLSEKLELENHLKENYGSTTKWWVGFERDDQVKGKWNWLAKEEVNNQITKWKNPRWRTRPGNFCGEIQTSPDLKVSIHRCTSPLSYICEYHTIAIRPQVTVVTTPEPPAAYTTTTTTTTTASTEAARSSNSRDERAESSARTSRRAGSSSTPLQDPTWLCAGDSALYQRYLQSQIEANQAKMKYYTEVSSVYQVALAAQKRYYESHQVMVDLQLEKMRQEKDCK